MKKLFLFALSAMMICSCSESGTEDNPKPKPNPTVTLTEIELSSSTLEFDTNGGEKSIDVYLNYDGYSDKVLNDQWELTGGESWCKPSITSGYNGDKITFTVDTYTGTMERTAKFTISCGNITNLLTITQAGYAIVHINVETAGTLANATSGLEKDEIVALKITGAINDEDILTIRALSNLEYLDLSELLTTILPANSFRALKLKYVMLPNVLTTITESLFSNCESLKWVLIPSNVRKIEGRYDDDEYYGAFYNCTALTEITIPANIEIIPSCTFQNCRSLETIIFEKGSKLRLIGGGCFGIPSSSFPNASAGGTIGPCYYYGAFSGCTALKSIEIPASVETIETSAFYNCESLETIVFEKGAKLKTIVGGHIHYGDGTEDNPARSWYRGAFNGCKSLSVIEFPASLETIGSATFAECYSLKTVTFEKESKLKYLERHAFNSCHNLTTVDASSCTQIEEIEYAAFYPCRKLGLFKIGTKTVPTCDSAFDDINPYSVLKVPSGCVDAYKNAKGWNKFTSISELDE